MRFEDLIKSLGEDPEFKQLMLDFCIAREGEWRARRKQAVLLYIAKRMDEAVAK